MSKKILITGAAGFIGSHLVEKLFKDGYNLKLLVPYNVDNSWGWIDSLDEKINELIYKQASEAEITDYVFKNNKKIFLNGLEAVIAGETSITEILRVSQE